MEQDFSNMQDEHIRELAARFLEGTATSEEEAILKEWYYSFADEEDLVAPTDARERIRAGIQTYISGKGSVVRWYSRNWVRAAAAVLIISMGWMLWRKNREAKVVTAAVIRSFTASTTGGERKHLVLPDSTVVWLNAGSRLDYTEGADRQINLEGEAFFEVKEDKSRPFVVRAGETLTRVLGTAFNIKAYKGDGLIRVTVSSGKVQVKDSRDNEKVLTGGFQATLKDTVLSERSVRTDAYTDWVQGKLDFDNATFEEVAGALSRKFGVTFHFRNEHLRQCTFLAAFDDQTSLKTILRLLCSTGNASFSLSKDEKLVTLTGKGCD